jgi:endonuclease/exonuclease/phosphatase family metal-dependent hydrolase
VWVDSTTYWHQITLPNGDVGYVSRSWSTLEADLRLGTWNVKKLGHGSSKSYATIAEVINENFDILTLIEVMQKGQGHPGYDALLQELGRSWAGVISETPRPSTKAGDAEYYAILYRPAAVHPCVDGPTLQYFPDNDGSPQGTGPDLFVREPAFACFETVSTAGTRGWDFILAAYHATWADGDEDIIVEEVDQLSQVFAAMKHARPGEADLFVAGDFNLTPDVLKEHSTAADKTTGTGSTLNSSGARTSNLYDHLLVSDSQATSELVMSAQVLDVRKKASTNKMFYKTVSDHLPIVGRFIRNRADDD